MGESWVRMGQEGRVNPYRFHLPPPLKRGRVRGSRVNPSTDFTSPPLKRSRVRRGRVNPSADSTSLHRVMGRGRLGRGLGNPTDFTINPPLMYSL